jgi:hypothetical protein
LRFGKHLTTLKSLQKPRIRYENRPNFALNSAVFATKTKPSFAASPVKSEVYACKSIEKRLFQGTSVM